MSNAIAQELVSPQDLRQSRLESLYVSKTVKKLFESTLLRAENSSGVLVSGAQGTEASNFAREIYEHIAGLRGFRPGLIWDAHSQTSNSSELANSLAALGPGKHAILLNEIEKISPKDQQMLANKLSAGNDSLKVIAMTAKDLESLAKNGQFNLELFYQISIVKVRIPKLCEKLEEILFLADFFLGKCSGGKQTFADRPAIHRRLARHHWPGNILELECVVRRASASVLPEEEPYVHARHIQFDARGFLDVSDIDSIVPLLMDQFEKLGGAKNVLSAIQAKALTRYTNRVNPLEEAEIALNLGIDTASLWRLRRKLRIPRQVPKE